MNANQIIDKVLSDARQQAEDLLRQASEHRNQQTKALDTELAAYRTETDRLAKAASEDRQARILAASRMQNGRQMLAAKAQVLDELFARVREQFEKLPDGDYLELIKRILKKAVQSGQEEVIVGKNETRLTQDFLNKVNVELLWQAKGGLKLSPSREDISGGFILSSGKVRVNASTDVVVSQLRDELEMEFAATLFQ